METTDVDRRQLGEAGLSEALDRLRSRIEGTDSGDPRVSLAEVLTWLFALWKHHKFTPSASLSASSGEQILAGLIFARHQVAHRLEDVAHLVTWSSLPFTISPGLKPVSYGSQIRWKPRQELNATQPHPHLEPLYDKHVANAPILQPLDAAVNFITALP